MTATIIRWIAVILLIDSGIAMIGMPYWRRLMPGINLEKMALIEAFISVALLLVSFAI